MCIYCLHQCPILAPVNPGLLHSLSKPHGGPWPVHQPRVTIITITAAGVRGLLQQAVKYRIPRESLCLDTDARSRLF